MCRIRDIYFFAKATFVRCWSRFDFYDHRLRVLKRDGEGGKAMKLCCEITSIRGQATDPNLPSHTSGVCLRTYAVRQIQLRSKCEF